MSRSGYVDTGDWEDDEIGTLNLYRANVARSIRSKRGQAFLREMAAAMDAMPEKFLIADELVTAEGEVCAIGSVCKARGLDVSGTDPEEPDEVAKLVGISRILAAEIEYENDEGGWHENDEQRWTRMRHWIDSNLIKAKS
jgi:hypothetical protein